MDEFIKKLIERLEERSEKWLNIWQNSTKDGNSNNYADGMNDAFIESTEIVKELAEQYADCYKDCGECEAYDKEKHHCPKFCMVIKDALAEIEENRGGWILCSERLPEEHDSIFARFKGTGKWNDAMFEKISDEVNVTVVDEHGVGATTHAHTSDGNWFCDLLMCNKSYRIIAWQPLPAPYQPKGE